MIDFIKMEATGNDYIFVNIMNMNIENIEYLKKNIKSICDRNFGIGSDGIILIDSSLIADAKMLMYNKDGSKGKMCGNGIRCLAKYLFENGITCKKDILIETDSGIKVVKLQDLKNIKVYMGKPNINAISVPVLIDKTFFINEPLMINNVEYLATCLSMGNPHTVINYDDLKNLDIEYLGPKIECHYRFPEKTNVEFVKYINNKKIEVRVWERGSGETLSCGSGACASVVSGILNHLLLENEDIEVALKGGVLKVRYNNDDSIILTGPANKVYEGKILIKNK